MKFNFSRQFLKGNFFHWKIRIGATVFCRFQTWGPFRFFLSGSSTIGRETMVNGILESFTRFLPFPQCSNFSLFYFTKYFLKIWDFFFQYLTFGPLTCMDFLADSKFSNNLEMKRECQIEVRIYLKNFKFWLWLS